jgi:cation diffusion facilitator family transporter
VSPPERLQAADGGSAGIDTPDRDAPGARYAEVRRVTLVGSVVDLALGIVKIAGGWAWNSGALIADGVHSLSDLATDVGVLLAARHAAPSPDDEHPYGHGRIETVATAGLGLSLVAVAAGIAWDAAGDLFHPEQLRQPAVAAIGVAAVSVLSKEAIYHYTMRYARRLKSKMLRANAWHSRTDAFSSIIVIIGVAGTLAGLEYLDAVAAVVVAWMVARVGWDLSRESVGELIDTGLGTDEVSAIRGRILEVEGVEDLHMLRTRQMAGQALVDVHINLEDPRISASEAHHISEQVRRQLISDIDDVADVTVHADIEDDHVSYATNRLPPREQVLRALEGCWAGLPGPKRVTLHYIGGAIEADVELPLELAGNREQVDSLERAFRGAVKGAPVTSVKLLFS